MYLRAAGTGSGRWAPSGWAVTSGAGADAGPSSVSSWCLGMLARAAALPVVVVGSSASGEGWAGVRAAGVGPVCCMVVSIGVAGSACDGGGLVIVGDVAELSSVGITTVVRMLFVRSRTGSDAQRSSLMAWIFHAGRTAAGVPRWISRAGIGLRLYSRPKTRFSALSSEAFDERLRLRLE